jgi:hypothetical protein
MASIESIDSAFFCAQEHTAASNITVTIFCMVSDLNVKAFPYRHSYTASDRDKSAFMTVQEYVGEENKGKGTFVSPEITGMTLTKV